MEFIKKYGIYIICILCLVFFTQNRQPDSKKKLDGIAYIKEQENLEVDNFSKKMNQLHNEEIKAAAKKGIVDVFSYFHDFVLMGDSRTMGYSTYGFLEESRVLADSGNTVYSITDYLDQLDALKVHYIFFSYGVNDLVSNLDDLDGGFDGLYENQIKEALKHCPKDVHVYVNSIIPASEETTEANEEWKKVDAYNKKIKKMCERNGWTYIDNNQISNNGKADIYAGDGIHFESSFYKTWALNMLPLEDLS